VFLGSALRHKEAVLAFEAAAHVDPTVAMNYLEETFAWGPSNGHGRMEI
jgi:hypothetical protein